MCGTTSNSKIKTENTLIVFVKNFELGKVKTRLAKSVGDERALQIYEAMVGRLAQELLELSDCRICIYYSNFVEQKELWPPSSKFFIQAKGDLGVRMRSAIAEQLQSSNAIVLIGTDVPKLTSIIIQNAFNSLRESDVTIGGTYDGGYYLIGANNDYPFLFENMIWSIESVFDETIKRSVENNKHISQLEVLSDVDYIEDWKEHGWELE